MKRTATASSETGRLWIGQTMACAYLQERVIWANTILPPSASDWAHCMEFFHSMEDPSRYRVLIYSEGGGPTASQRLQMKQVLGGANALTAVVTQSPLVRAIGVVIGWFNPSLRMFSPEDWAGAFVYLRYGPEERRWAQAALLQMSARLSYRALRELVEGIEP